MRLGYFVYRLLLQIWIFSALVHAYPPSELQRRENTAATRFTIMRPGIPGHCDNTADTMVDDAVTLINMAVQSLVILLSPNIPNNEDNRIYADAAAQMWGSRHVIDGDTIILTGGERILQEAKENYIQALKLLKERSIILTCGDQQWKWARTLAEAGIPTNPGERWNADTPIAEFFNLDVKQYPGLWFNPFLQNFASEHSQNIDANGMVNRDTYCRRGEPATDTTPAKSADFGKALYHVHAIVICDETFDSILAESLADVWDREENIRLFTPIETQECRGTTLTHEIMHIVSDQIKDLQVRDIDGTLKSAYGWAASAEVAMSGYGLENADNYALYALAVVLSPAEYYLGKKGKRPGY